MTPSLPSAKTKTTQEEGRRREKGEGEGGTRNFSKKAAYIFFFGVPIP